MSNKKQIENLKTNSERTIQGLLTEPQEFVYKRTGGFVKPNQVYSIYYTTQKREVYLTGVFDTSNSKFISKLGKKSILNRYADIKSQTKKPYPKTTPAKPNESDYKIRFITRYFSRIANDISKPVFEVSKKDFNKKNSLYIYFSFRWVISGTKNAVIRENNKTILRLRRTYPNITNIIFPLQFWIPPKNSIDDLEKKLERLKKT